MADSKNFYPEYPQLNQELTLVYDLIQEQIGNVNGTVGEALSDVFSITGKLLRPTLLLLFGGLNKSYDQDKLVHLAASIEMLHNATLIHDDIIDESDLRRGIPSVQAKYGKHIAVYAGDYLFALCYRVLSDYSSNIRSVRYDGKLMEQIIGGELDQLSTKYNIQINRDQYLQQITGKTAKIFGLSCFLGIYESNGSLRKAQKAQEIGDCIGKSFQILDDILDYTTNTQTLGKPILQDVKEGVYSLPLIFALQNDSSGEIKTLLEKKEKISDSELLQLQTLVKNNHGIEQANDVALEFTERATTLLYKTFGTSPETKKIDQIFRKMLIRSY